MMNVLLHTPATTLVEPVLDAVSRRTEQVWRNAELSGGDLSPEIVTDGAPGLRWDGTTFASARLEAAGSAVFCAQGGLRGLGVQSPANRAFAAGKMYAVRNNNGILEAMPAANITSANLFGHQIKRYTELGVTKFGEIGFIDDELEGGEQFDFCFAFRWEGAPSPQRFIRVSVRNGGVALGAQIGTNFNNVNVYNFNTTNAAMTAAGSLGFTAAGIGSAAVEPIPNSDAVFVCLTIQINSAHDNGIGINIGPSGDDTGVSRTFDVLPLYLGPRFTSTTPKLKDWYPVPGSAESGKNHGAIVLNVRRSVPRTLAVVAARPEPAELATLLELKGDGRTARVRHLANGDLELSSGKTSATVPASLWPTDLAVAVGLRVDGKQVQLEVDGVLRAGLDAAWTAIDTGSIGGRHDGSEPFSGSLVRAVLTVDPQWVPPVEFITLADATAYDVITPVKGWLYGWKA
jgi:hypothetical protein